MLIKEDGISDISSSEGKISDFTKICKIIDSNHALHQKKIFSELQRITKSKSYGSFQRKISIMQKLNLIEIIGEKCILGSYGKVLTNIVQRNGDHMETLDKSLYFIILFSSVSRMQLASFLDTINHQHGRGKKEVIIEYFSTPIALKLWNHNKRLENNVKSLKQTDIVPSMLNNKFTCMKDWLETIDLIEIKMDGLYTKVPSTVINSLTNHSRIKNIHEDAAAIYYEGAKKYDNLQHFDVLSKLVLKAHNLFCIKGSGISDVQAVSKFVCLKFLEMKIIFEEERFFEMTRILIEKDIIRSLMVGRDGTLTNLTV